MDVYERQGYSRQRTLKSRVSCTGVGLHSGARVGMALTPGDENSGILFVRTDLAGAPIVHGRWDSVIDTRMGTTLSNVNGVSVATVEHVMAALAGLGVDNVVVEVDGPEVPIMDGSAAPFVFLIECAGIVEQDAPRRAVRVLAPVVVEGRGWSASLLPAARAGMDIEIDFDNPAISRQFLSLDLEGGTFKRDLARARTFGFLHEVEQLQAAGLARGGSLENAVVISGDTILNPGGLRFQDEFIRHKALDAVGDLFLAGGPIIGRFQGVRTGHAANNRLLRALFARKDAWRWDLLESGDSEGDMTLRPWTEDRRLAAAL